jgi:hypothetical protein
MAIELGDIRRAIATYLAEKVSVQVTDFKATDRGAINENEQFTFRVEVKNSDAANDGIQLPNVRYRLKVTGGNSVLIVKREEGTALDPEGKPLDKDIRVTDEYIFVPTGTRRHCRTARGSSRPRSAIPGA